eukprot:s4302_g2.t1
MEPHGSMGLGQCDRWTSEAPHSKAPCYSGLWAAKGVGLVDREALARDLLFSHLAPKLRVLATMVSKAFIVAFVLRLASCEENCPPSSAEDCPELTCNKGGGDDPPNDGDPAAASSAVVPKTPAELEEDVIRIKSLTDLSFPNPPQNAAQARGFVNQTLMAIGKLQKTPGDEVYIWAQDCLKMEPDALRKDGRFPRLDREIAAKLIKVCRHGRFGLLFQHMVESERLKSGGMPNGRCMLRAIYRHFQLERDRVGMLAERNLLNIKMSGDGVAHLEAFRDKYLYVVATIPVEDMPKESTLFNHLIDELEKARPETKLKLKFRAPLLPRAKAKVARAERATAKTPCMFWAFGACKGDPCPFLHDSKNKYTGPKPESLAAKADAKAKPKAKAKANAATAPLVNAVPAELNQDGKITWLWDTAAGRHLIGRQALTSKALSCVTRPETPVGFATGGYVLKECPPAFSVGKAVLDEGAMFVWDPREHRPYFVKKEDVHRCRLKVPRKARINATRVVFVKKEDVHRCRLKVPRKARINATRVVEYVPQFDETLQPARREHNPSLSPVTASANPASKEDDTISFSDFEIEEVDVWGLRLGS